MVNVIAWPPVSITAYEFTVTQPIGLSESLFDEYQFVSQAQKERRVGFFEVQGIGINRAGSGYVEMLKRQLKGGVHLVRLPMPSAVWQMAAREIDRVTFKLNWTIPSAPLAWDIPHWSTGLPLAGAPAVDGSWSALLVEGFPPNEVVAYPSEHVTVTNSVSVEKSTVLTIATSNSLGVALIRVTGPFTISGLVSIGAVETAVFRLAEMPRSRQPASGNWAYAFNFKEVFAAETTGFVEVDPWN